VIVKAKAIKEIGRREDWRAVAFSPIGKYDDLKVSEYFTFTCSGSNFPYISIGREYEIEIEEQKMYRGNMTYSIVGCPSLDKLDFNNLSREEAFEIIMDCTSSPRIANNILNAYPNFLEIILTDGKDSIDTNKIDGVGDSYLSSYSRTINEKYKYYHVLKKWNMYKLDVKDCKKLFDIYGNEDKINEAINKNPYYVLIELCENTFSYADKLITSYRKDLSDSKERCEALILNILKLNEQDGSTRLSGAELYYYVKTDYNLPQLIPMLKDVSVYSDLIFYDEETKYLSKMSTYLAECRIAEFVKDKLENSVKLDIDWEKYKIVDDFELTDSQLGALENFCKYNISVLAGFSGSGKSASVKNLVKLMEDNGLSYVLLSSTGKASKVLSESTNRKATTIHKRCFQGEIDSDVVLIDEASMVSLDVMIMLIHSITNENCRIIFVGDPAQASPISLGKPFSDMIESHIVPITMLTEIFRYKSNGSLFVATNVRNGKSFFNDNEMVKRKDDVLSISKNYKFIQRENDKILDCVVEEYMKLIKKGIKKEDIMVLSPFNVKETGSYAINNKIQAEINPPKPNEKFHLRNIGDSVITFRLNDLVMNTKNNYQAIGYEEYQEMINSDGLIKPEDLGKYTIVNGQIGIVRQVLDDGLIVQFDEDLIWISKFQLNNLLLSYALGIHRAQGTSIDYTIGVLSTQHSKMMSRNLLYVADTRCRKAHIDIGSIEAFENALQIEDNDLRDTYLLELLSEIDD